MATGAGSSNEGTSATPGSVPDSDESNEYNSEWDMDEARGLRSRPSGGGNSAFDPNRAPPPESLPAALVIMVGFVKSVHFSIFNFLKGVRILNW